LNVGNCKKRQFAIKLIPEVISDMKKVYVGMSADIVHTGHLNIIKEARKYGEVIVGVLTDKAIASYKRLPFLSLEERKTIIENIKGVSQVVLQETLDYVPNLKKIKPDYVVHGDDWRTGPQWETRERVLQALKEWGGELIEPGYTQGISSTMLNAKVREVGTTPGIRIRVLRRLLAAKRLIRIMEAHNGLTGLIVEKTQIKINETVKEFDGMWLSSLTDSVSKGKPDIGFVDLTSRMNTLNNILEVTTKPVIFDGDSGGLVDHFKFMVRTLEREGISAVIIEDKVGAKRNSLFGTEVQQIQDTIENFCEKIRAGKEALVTDDFMIIARIESLILKVGMDDAIKRAEAYIKAGADAIMIHSKEKKADEILEFCRRYKKIVNNVPLVVVPSTYSHITEEELEKEGVRIVIYANQLLRSSYPVMKKVAESILENRRARECDEMCISIKEILTLIPGSK